MIMADRPARWTKLEGATHFVVDTLGGVVYDLDMLTHPLSDTSKRGRVRRVDYQLLEAHLESLTHSARILVRESGYTAARAEAELTDRGYLYSNVMHTYDMACVHLHKVDPQGAQEFINSTYGPAFRQSAA